LIFKRSPSKKRVEKTFCGRKSSQRALAIASVNPRRTSFLRKSVENISQRRELFSTVGRNFRVIGRVA